MIINSMESECSQFPISDYDALEREVASTREHLRTLEPRYAALTEQLDRITAPSQLCNENLSASTAGASSSVISSSRNIRVLGSTMP